jgi:hypothetical protein
MRIFLTDPFRMLCRNLKPKPVSQVRVEESAWMEAVTTLDHFPRFPILKVSFLEHVLRWEIVVDIIEVFKGMTFGDDVLILL